MKKANLNKILKMNYAEFYELGGYVEFGYPTFTITWVPEYAPEDDNGSIFYQRAYAEEDDTVEDVIHSRTSHPGVTDDELVILIVTPEGEWYTYEAGELSSYD